MVDAHDSKSCGATHGSSILPPGTMNFVAVILSSIFELIIMGYFILTIIIGSFLPLRSVLVGNGKYHNVVISTGFLTRGVFHFFQKNYLEAYGLRVYIADFGYNTEDIAETAEKLQHFFNKHQLEDVVLVGCSEGSLVGYYFLEHLNGWPKVRKFIAIAGPFHGAPAATLMPFVAANQMSPDSPFLKDLLKKESKHKDKMITVQAYYDELVPRKSSHIKHYDNRLMHLVGHGRVQGFSNEVNDLIRKYARKES